MNSISHTLYQQMKIDRAEDVELLFKAQKESESGIFTNDRLLMIKAGIISYFSQISKKFTGNAKFLQSSGQFPKYTIKANEIYHLELKDGVLSMMFKKSKLISRNEFKDMVKKKDYQPDRASQISVKEEGNGFVRWNFQCENIELMKQFVRLTNLFRTNNAKFQPNLSSLLSTFRGQKQKQERQMSMKPAVSNKMYTSDTNKKRMSQVPSGELGGDLFLESLGIGNKQEEKKQIRKSKPIQIPTPIDEATARAELAKQIERRESQRLNRRKSHLTSINRPPLGLIEQKQNEDKLSQMSKNLKDAIVQRKIQIKVEPQLIQEIIINEKKEQIPTQIQQKPNQDSSQSILQSQTSQIQISELVVESIKPPQQPIIQEQMITTTIKQTKEQSAFKKKQKPKNGKYQLTLNTSYESQWKSAQEEVKRKKNKKLKQFFKATSYIDHFNPQQICQKLSISLEELQSLMKTHSRQEQSAWAYIQNNLAYHLAKQKNDPNNLKIKRKLSVNDEIIKEYYKIGQYNNEQNFQFLKISLQNEVSFISAEPENEQQAEAIDWMQRQMQDSFPKQFSSKITNKSHFKIYIRPLQFNRQNIIHLKGGWIVNHKGYLQEFLAYLRLQKVVKEISMIISDDIELTCGDAIYLRYKQYEGIAKQWRIGYPCFPIKSIKALQYITKSKQMRHFQNDFPQFNVITQIIKQGYVYRLHLDRIQSLNSKNSQKALLCQLKKLIFPFDNELDIFYNSNQYTQIENICLSQIQSVIGQKSKINEEGLYSIMQKMENNITVDTLCKLLGCRIDKKGNIYFHHTILRLGGRQFGEQISLIKRSKKKGNMELGRQLSKRLMGKLKQYQYVTPISHFIEIYLQIIDFMIVNEGELHRAVPILHKVLTHLGDCQAEQYPIYLSLMKTYLKLNQMDNFIKALQNCRLFISQMFKQYSPLLDYPLQRIIIMILLKEDTNRALTYSSKILKQIKQNTLFSQNIKQKYVSKIEWDKNNILLELGRNFQSYNDCIDALKDIQSKHAYYPDYWIDGVLCLSRSWLQISEVNSINSAELQKRLARAIQLSFSRQNLQMVFILFQSGLKVLNRCQELNLPKLLDSQHAFQLAQIQFNQTQAQIFYLLTTKQ